MNEVTTFKSLRELDHSFDAAAEHLHRTVTAADYDRVILLVHLALQRQGETMFSHTELIRKLEQLNQLFSDLNDRVVLVERAYHARDQHKIDRIAAAVKKNRAALAALLGTTNQPPAQASEKGD